MAIGNTKINGALHLGNLASAPSPVANGMMYYDTTLNKIRLYQNGGWIEAATLDELAASTGASLVGFDPSGLNVVTASTVQGAIAELDTFINNLDPLPDQAGHNGEFLKTNGTTADWAALDIADVDGLQNALDNKADDSDLSNYIPLTQKDAANGVATLDANGKIPSSQIPAMAITETFVVADEAAMLALDAQVGDVAIRSDLSKTFILQGSDPTELTDWVELQTPASPVLSVNGQTGAVSLDSDDIAEGSTNLYFTDARAKTAAVVDSTAGSETDQAASVSAMKSYVSSQLPAEGANKTLSNLESPTAINEDLLPGSDSSIDLGSSSNKYAELYVNDAHVWSNFARHGASSSAVVYEVYRDEINLSASQTNTVIGSLSWPHASYDALEIVYKIKENTTNTMRIGTLRIVTDGVNVLVNDLGTSLGAGPDVSFDATINGSQIEVNYTSGSNTALMRADVKLFRV